MTNNNRIASSFLRAMTTGWAFETAPVLNEKKRGVAGHAKKQAGR
jgi:hypothetical protein